MFKRIEVGGWKSFSPEAPYSLPELSQTNLLIGPNNAGKSNLGRFLVWLRSQLVNLVGAGDMLQITKRQADIQTADLWMCQRSTKISAKIVLDATKVHSHRSELFSINNEIELAIQRWPNGQFLVTPMLASANTPLLLRMDSGEIFAYNTSKKSRDSAVTDPTHEQAYKDLLRFVSSAILYIEPFRDPFSSKGSEPLTTNGSNTIKLAHEMYVTEQRSLEWAEFRDQIALWTKVLLNENNHVTIDPLVNNIRLTFSRGNAKLPMHFRDLGTGVSEFFVLLAFLKERQNSPAFVLLEEPEAHLHPGATVRLMRIIAEELGSKQVLATSHSTSLVDAVDESWRLYRVAIDSNGASRATALPAARENIALMADLGIRPSQLWLANCAIWVEGPSDVIYLRRLLRDHAPDLVEGRDFGFLFYGGASIAHVEVGDPVQVSERLVRVSQLAQKNVVVCDRDRKRGDELKKHVERLTQESTEKLGYSIVLVTPGREIENLLDPARLFAAVVAHAPKSKNVDGAKIEIQYPSTDIPEDARFGDVVAAGARGPNGAAISDDTRKAIAEDIGRRKTDIALHCVGEQVSPFRADSKRFAVALAARVRANE